MKEVDLAAVLRRNPLARRDQQAMKDAQAAIKQRRKAGFFGKTYDLDPPIGGSRRGILHGMLRFGKLA